MSDSFEHVDTSDDETRYKLVLDLLMVNKQGYRILVPDSMVRLLLSYNHLLGHLGITKILNNLQNYYFQDM